MGVIGPRIDSYEEPRNSPHVEWVLIDERWPPECLPVLVLLRNGTHAVVNRWQNDWHPGELSCADAIAWVHLPRPPKMTALPLGEGKKGADPRPDPAVSVTATPSETEHNWRRFHGAPTFASCPECGSPADISVEIARERLAMVNAFAGALAEDHLPLAAVLTDLRRDLEELIYACQCLRWPYDRFEDVAAERRVPQDE